MKNKRHTTGNEKLEKRTNQFALDVIKLVPTLPSNRACNILGGQSLSAGRSVGANYHAPAGKIHGGFHFKMGTVQPEADDSGFGMELLVDSGGGG